MKTRWYWSPREWWAFILPGPWFGLRQRRYWLFWEIEKDMQ